MSVKCPLCDTDNHDSAAECATCGKPLAVNADLLVDVAPVPGLEQTLYDALENGPGIVQAVPDLERTQLARRDLRVADEVVPGVERTPIEADPRAPSNWTGGAPIESGREPDDGERTPPPEDTGFCPWCGNPVDGAICDGCGRRVSRYTAPPTAGPSASPTGIVRCPSCFGRVAAGPRCSECGLPFPVAELV